MQHNVNAPGLRVDSPHQEGREQKGQGQEGYGQDALEMLQAPTDARTIHRFFDLETPGISGFAVAILSERGGVHIDLCKSQQEQVSTDDLDRSIRSIVEFMREHRVESVGVNTRGGAEGSFIGADLERVIESLKPLPKVALEVVCHLDHDRAFPFAPGEDRLALHKALRNMENLVGLDLRGAWDTAMVLDAVATCGNLRFLAVRDMNMVDSELGYLTDLTQLRKLELENGEVQGVGFQTLVHLPLESVFLRTQNITSEGFTALSELRSLKEFGIRANAGVSGLTDVTVESLKPLGVLPQLKVLYSPDIHKNSAQLDALAEMKETGLFPALVAVRGDW